MYNQQQIYQIISAVPLAELIGEYIPLRKYGRYLLGQCPRHKGNNMTLIVSPQDGVFYCKECGISGNAIHWLIHSNRFTYDEAIEHLVQKYAIRLDETATTNADREAMFQVNEYCLHWFEEQLWNKAEGQTIGLSYLRERGLSDETIRCFKIGYSPEKGSPLSKSLQENGFDAKYCLTSTESSQTEDNSNLANKSIGTGVCGKSEKGEMYDRFRGRVIFPFSTIHGRTVAFAGRLIKQKENAGKYVNSPESLIYSKRRELYGIYQAKKHIEEKDRCILVEGQMDVISMYQAGIRNVVSSGGTALTKEHVQIIKSLTNKVTILYDGDAAGIKASQRAIEMFLKVGMEVQGILLPDKHDPDSFLKEHTGEEFAQYIALHSQDFIGYLHTLKKEEIANDPSEEIGFIHQLIQYVSYIKDYKTKEEYINKIAALSGLDDYQIKAEIEKEENSTSSANITTTATNTSALQNMLVGYYPQTSLEKAFDQLIRLLVRFGNYTLHFSEQEQVYADDFILQSLEQDDIQPPQGIIERILSAYKSAYTSEGFDAKRYFCQHTDLEISAYAAKIYIGPYQLSKIFKAEEIEGEENSAKKYDENEDINVLQLPEIVRDTVLEVKLQYIELLMAQALQAQKNTNDINSQLELMKQCIDLTNTRNELKRLLKRN